MAVQKSKHPMPEQDPKKRIKNFDEVPLGYDDHTAIEEAKRCLQCKTKPCMEGCPVEIDIPDISVDGDFYIGVFTNWQPQGHILWLGADTDPPHSYRSFFVRDDTNGIYSIEDNKDWMIRAVGHP